VQPELLALLVLLVLLAQPVPLVLLALLALLVQRELKVRKDQLGTMVLMARPTPSHV
tara:strand:+ start:331 stop:501 length:171 start_codon:yes stop_codon:yes gene_type:complete